MPFAPVAITLAPLASPGGTHPAPVAVISQAHRDVASTDRRAGVLDPDRHGDLVAGDLQRAPGSIVVHLRHLEVAELVTGSVGEDRPLVQGEVGLPDFGGAAAQQNEPGDPDRDSSHG